MDDGVKRCIIADVSPSFLEELEALLPVVALTFEREYGTTEIEVFYACKPVLRKKYNVSEFKTQSILDEDASSLPDEISEENQQANAASMPTKTIHMGGGILGVSFDEGGGSNIKAAVELARGEGFTTMMIITDGWIT